MNVLSKLTLPDKEQDIAFSCWIDGNDDRKIDISSFSFEE